MATKGEARMVRGAARRQQAALAGVRRWHEGALRAQAKEFSETKSQADATQRENVRFPGLPAQSWRCLCVMSTHCKACSMCSANVRLCMAERQVEQAIHRGWAD